MGSSTARRERSALPVINVTPLIDILLVLLIIFMVITPLKPSRFKALIPQPPDDDPRIEKSPHTLVVSIDKDLRVKLIKGEDIVAEGAVGDTGSVAARLAQEFAERKEKRFWRIDDRPDLFVDDGIERTVFIRAPRSIWYGDVAKVIDGIKGAGANPVGLQTDELTD
jgi:biopolymer transport protein TolR